MSDLETTLIFVYNADSGLLNALNDGILKVLSPSTYDCRLCGLTFGVVSMKTPWRRFIESLDLPVEFLHRDEFGEKYDYKGAEFPSVYVKTGEEMLLFISRDEMNSMESLDELMELVKGKLDNLVRE
jgi:hypothetical protein